eukprot:SAG31_NODE_1365_length_8621_cov_61.731049_5_plen_49_part_00
MVTDVAKMISSVPEVLKMVTDGQVDVGSLLSSLQVKPAHYVMSCAAIV